MVKLIPVYKDIGGLCIGKIYIVKDIKGKKIAIMDTKEKK